MGVSKKDSIKVLRKPEPYVCGGTDATLDTKAPKEITSKNMTLFNVCSALNAPRGSDAPLGYISAYAAESGDGTFLFFEKCEGHFHRGEREYGWAYVKGDAMPALCELVRERDIAKNNGFHSKTHGLPENFGGSIDIRYGSGERISISNNQSPVLSYETGVFIADFFKNAMNGEKIKLPVLSSLVAIIFEEKRKNGGFTAATLTFNADGTGTNKKAVRYDDPHIYESTKTVEAETVDMIKDNIEKSGILSWSGLPESNFDFLSEKQLTFVFKDNDSITVKNGKILPDKLSRAFFNIELEMTAKH